MSPQNNSENEDRKNYEALGKILASPDPGEEVVISGLAGRYPDSHDVYHFRDNLYNKVDMVSADTRRWEPTHPEIPQRTGKIYDISKFDAGFFGVHQRQANTIDPMGRLFLERALEAIFDAGMHPSDLEGTKTGVFVGTCFSETERAWYFEKLEHQGHCITGTVRSMIANRLSYYLKLQGPSFICDTACSSSLYAFENAYKAIRTGVCDMAIVGGTNLCLHPFVSLQFARLGVLSDDGSCKAFDNTGNGYARSEAICAVLLQKAKDAKRVYAQVLHAKTNCDGYKEQGITYPSGEMQKRLLHEFYQECDIDPRTLSFLEAHGTGTKVGDPEEVGAIDDVFCKDRDTPLLIGSVKSNIGHTEPSSGLCSITKCIIGMENGFIPPNLHYQTPREGVEALEKGRVKVVTEKMPFEDDRGLLGVNSFGFGGGNCHVLLRWNQKKKLNGGQPRDELPRLVCVSARTPFGVSEIFDDLNSRKLDVEHIRLLQEVFRKDIQSHIYRGHAILSKDHGELKRHCQYFSGERVPLVFAFGSFDKTWQILANYLFSVPLFAASIQKIHNILAGKGVNITEIIQSTDRSLSVHPLVASIMGNLSLQIGIVDILKTLDIVPDLLIGYTFGELMCAYVDGSLNLVQILNIALEIANAIKDINQAALVYVVELGEKQIRSLLPFDVEILGQNSRKHVTISGNPKTVTQFVAGLKAKGVGVTEVSFRSINLHSKNIAKIESKLIPKLKKIITQPTSRGARWFSSSTEKVASAEYFVKALESQIFFNELCGNIPKDSVILEIGDGQFLNLLKHALDNKSYSLYFNQRADKNLLVEFIDIIGSIYDFGYNPQIEKLYPKVQFPVSRGTPMISPKIKWSHDKDWYIRYYRSKEVKSGERELVIQTDEENWSYTLGHVVDGRGLFPATGYLFCVWDTFSRALGVFSDNKIVFENCKFLRATNIGPAMKVEFTIMIQKVSGNFEVIEGGVPVVTGRIYITDEGDDDTLKLPIPVGIETEEAPALLSKDIYKELRLRGYNYKGAFRALEKCDSTASKGLIKWTGNWVTFMDNMLQMQILQVDTRLLYVPTCIKKLSIDVKKHTEYSQGLSEGSTLIPVYVYRDIRIIRAGGIEVRGLNASSIARRKPLGEPVLEKYDFISNNAILKTHESVRVNMQIALENNYGIKVKALELIDEETDADSEPLGPLVHEVFGDQPLIQPNITVLSTNPLELPHVNVENKKLMPEGDALLVVGSKILQRSLILQQAFAALKEKGFILSREHLSFEPEKTNLEGMDILTVHTTEAEKLVFARKSIETKIPTVIRITNDNFQWLPLLQNAVKKDSDVIVYSQDEPLSGIMGMFNCIRREPGGMNVKCFFIVGKAPTFDINDPFYEQQLKKNMAVNVYKNGTWGTYRHLLLENIGEVDTEHAFVNVTVRGDLSSLKWIEGHLTSKSVLPPEQSLVTIYYTALNFRDIMTASGKINADVITMDRLLQECVQGFEFSGRTACGRRVMGLSDRCSMATILAADDYLLWPLPDHWTMEDAATVPTVYGTVLCALFIRSSIKRGNSILIHSGTGGIGQAAISLCLFYGITVYTTVGNQEKREYLKKRFPQLTDRHIGSSRDLSFETMIMKETNGRGVDYVLNSLAEEKLIASVRCLAQGGTFLEIGKFDLASDNPLQIMLLEKQASFKGIMLDMLINYHPSVKKDIGQLLMDGIRNGAIKPLPRVVFKPDELEQAFRYMATGKHMGKVIINVCKEEEARCVPPPIQTVKAVPRYSCDKDNVYIITGGLGGFGLELADWLVLRGARKLILTSRKGIKTGYQSWRVRLWRSYGAKIHISTLDITTKEGCEKLLRESSEFGPVHAIFNLAVVLRDALIENQTEENFQVSFGPKAHGTLHLDQLSRKMCPYLRDFVVFSSVSCGRGNTGQTNYGMANSIMERICEDRRTNGYPAIAIEWGAVGEVGLVAEMQEEHTDIEIGGTLQQRISNCLQVLDILLKQKEAAIVSSMVVAEKRGGAGGADNIVDAVANILGLKNLKTISLHATLAELGMDSMTAVEIKQTLEREFEVFLTAQDIRSMTFARLMEIQEQLTDETGGSIKKTRQPVGIELILRYLGDEATSTMPVFNLKSKIEDTTTAPIIFCFPGIEGFATTLKPLAANLEANVIGIQFCYDKPKNNYDELAECAVEQIKSRISKSKPFNIITYSWGTIIGLEAVAKLEKIGYRGRVICVDGAPHMLKEMEDSQIKTATDAEFETIVICHLMTLYIPMEIILKSREKIFRAKNFEERMTVAQQVAPEDTPHSPYYQRQVAIGLFTRLGELRTYEPKYDKIKSNVMLFKAAQVSVHNIPEDYKLSDLCEKPVEVKAFEGNHLTILDNIDLAEAINEIIKENPVFVKETTVADSAITNVTRLEIKQI